MQYNSEGKKILLEWAHREAKTADHPVDSEHVHS